MKKLEKVIAMMMVLGILAGAAGARADMVGTWTCEATADFGEEITSLWQYTFAQDGTYEYHDWNIGYQETGTYAIQGSRLILTRTDGGTEEYQLDAARTAIRMTDECGSMTYAKTDFYSVTASAEGR